MIAKYEQWLLQQPELMAALPELRGKVLGCWCSPNACHGDVLARLADSPTLADRVRDGGEEPGEAGGDPTSLADCRCDLCESLRAERANFDPALHEDPDDLTSVFVEFKTIDGRRGWARRGWNNPKAREYNPRLCTIAAIGVAEADRVLEDLQDEWWRQIEKSEKEKAMAKVMPVKALTLSPSCSSAGGGHGSPASNRGEG